MTIDLSQSVKIPESRKPYGESKFGFTSDIDKLIDSKAGRERKSLSFHAGKNPPPYSNDATDNLSGKRVVAKSSSKSLLTNKHETPVSRNRGMSTLNLSKTQSQLPKKKTEFAKQSLNSSLSHNMGTSSQMRAKLKLDKMLNQMGLPQQTSTKSAKGESYRSTQKNQRSVKMMPTTDSLVMRSDTNFKSNAIQTSMTVVPASHTVKKE